MVVPLSAAYPAVAVMLQDAPRATDSLPEHGSVSPPTNPLGKVAGRSQVQAVTPLVQLAAPSVEAPGQAVHVVSATASKKFSRHPVAVAVGEESTPSAEHE